MLVSALPTITFLWLCSAQTVPESVADVFNVVQEKLVKTRVDNGIVQEHVQEILVAATNEPPKQVPIMNEIENVLAKAKAIRLRRAREAEEQKAKEAVKQKEHQQERMEDTQRKLDDINDALKKGEKLVQEHEQEVKEKAQKREQEKLDQYAHVTDEINDILNLGSAKKKELKEKAQKHEDEKLEQYAHVTDEINDILKQGGEKKQKTKEKAQKHEKEKLEQSVDVVDQINEILDQRSEKKQEEKEIQKKMEHEVNKLIKNEMENAESIVDEVQAALVRIDNSLEETDDAAEDTREVVAYAVLISRLSDPSFMDQLAVLAQSVNRIRAHSKYKLKVVAICAIEVSAANVNALLKIGYDRVLRLPYPVNHVKNKFARDEMNKGTGEGKQWLSTYRYYGFNLTEYKRVMVLDADTIVTGPVDELVDADHDLSTTVDIELDAEEIGSRFPPINAGMTLMRPNHTVFNEIIALQEEGDFRPNTGWKGTEIGWAYGGATAQGLLSYYFHQHVTGIPMSWRRQDCEETFGAKKNCYEKKWPNERLNIVDPCKYNNIPTHCIGCPGLPDEPLQSCNRTVMMQEEDYDGCAGLQLGMANASVRLAHFTGSGWSFCNKPWNCEAPQSWLCRCFTLFWWKVRDEVRQLLKPNIGLQRCYPDGYQNMQFMPELADDVP